MSKSSSIITEEQYEKFKEIVRLVLNTWPCYQFAIKNQLGGNETAAKDNWFCEVLAEHICNKMDLYTFELSEWIAEILNNEFDTISEDGTLDPTAKLLLQMRNWLLGRGKENAEEQRQKLEENIQKLKAIGNKQNTCVAPQKVDEDEDSSSSDDNGEEDSEDEN